MLVIPIEFTIILLIPIHNSFLFYSFYQCPIQKDVMYISCVFCDCYFQKPLLQETTNSDQTYINRNMYYEQHRWRTYNTLNSWTSNHKSTKTRIKEWNDEIQWTRQVFVPACLGPLLKFQANKARKPLDSITEIKKQLRTCVQYWGVSAKSFLGLVQRRDQPFAQRTWIKNNSNLYLNHFFRSSSVTACPTRSKER